MLIHQLPFEVSHRIFVLCSVEVTVCDYVLLMVYEDHRSILGDLSIDRRVTRIKQRRFIDVRHVDARIGSS